jgi:hypothetical protein
VHGGVKYQQPRMDIELVPRERGLPPRRGQQAEIFSGREKTGPARRPARVGKRKRNGAGASLHICT